MTPLPLCRRPRAARLAVEPLEDRATPATALYSAFTQTLTITAGEGDRLVVAPVAGNVTLKLGDGENEVCLDGGLVRGNVLVTGGSGPDLVHVTDAGDLTVGGSAAFRLGGGANTLVGQGLAHTIHVGGNFVY